MRLLLLVLVALAAGCGGGGGKVTKPAEVAPAPDKSDPGLKGDTAAGPP